LFGCKRQGAGRTRDRCLTQAENWNVLEALGADHARRSSKTGWGPSYRLTSDHGRRPDPRTRRRRASRERYGRRRSAASSTNRRARRFEVVPSAGPLIADECHQSWYRLRTSPALEDHGLGGGPHGLNPNDQRYTVADLPAALDTSPAPSARSSAKWPLVGSWLSLRTGSLSSPDRSRDAMPCGSEVPARQWCAESVYGAPDRLGNAVSAASVDSADIVKVMVSFLPRPRSGSPRTGIIPAEDSGRADSPGQRR